jgi:hypothetical protein
MKLVIVLGFFACFSVMAQNDFDFKDCNPSLLTASNKAALVRALTENGYGKDVKIVVASNRSSLGPAVSIVLDGKEFMAVTGSEQSAFMNALSKISTNELDSDGKARFDRLVSASSTWTFSNTEDLNTAQIKHILARVLLEKNYEPKVGVGISIVRGSLGNTLHIALDGADYTGIVGNSEIHVFRKTLQKIEPSAGKVAVEQ